MPKNKKKIDVKVSAPVSSTATAKKQNPKVERAVRIAGAIATAAIPVGRGASVLGKVVSAVTKPKMASAGKVVKSKIVTQGPKARVTAKAPGKTGGAYSPVKGTKVKVEYETKGLSVSQQKNVTALTASQKARRGLSTAKGAAAGAIATSGGKNEKATKKKKK